MKANKIVLNGETLIDLTKDTVTEQDVAVGKTFHKANGEQATGICEIEGAVLQSKSVTFTSNGYNTILPDEDYTGLSQVDVTVNVVGGGDGGSCVGQGIRFLDYDGTVLVVEPVGPGIIPPDLPDYSLPDHANQRPALTFQGWNRDFSNPTGPMDVGALWVTSDGKTYFYFEVGFIEPVVMNFVKDSNTVLTATSSWGETTSVSSGTTVSITLNEPILGRQWIAIDSTGNYTLGQGSSATSAFSEGRFKNNLSKAYISSVDNNITSIGNSAFDGCYSLSSIIIPDNITSIGTYAFNGCYSLSSVILPDNITSIGRNAFRSCYSLSSIILPDNVTSIGSYVFNDCRSLLSIILPDNITSIDTDAFRDCHSLSSIILPDNVTSIGTYAFNNCYSLSSIILPDNITSIGTYAFRGCYSLSSIILPDNVTSIGTYAFGNDYSLSSIILPDNITSIGTNVFNSCRSLSSIIIPDNVTSIGTYAFSSCDNLTVVIVKSIVPPTLPNVNAFDNNHAGRKFYVPDEAVDDYKTATNWSNYASVIFPLSEAPEIYP